MSFVTCQVKHTLASSVNCYLKQCWEKNFYPSFIAKILPKKYAIMWNKETTRCSCSSFLLSFKFLFPEIQSNIKGKDQGCVRQWITSFIFFFDHEQAVSWESCNLIGSGSWQYFILFTGLGWYWEKLCPLYWYSPKKCCQNMRKLRCKTRNSDH